ncbi:MAG: hypothetical protein P4L87_21675 [Formivibrio sp.]|nr:hypothetical protein [Formivibrio sp.]
MIESPKRSATFNLTSCHIAAALVYLGMMLPAFGQQPFHTLLVGIDHRTVTSLNGDWLYLVDQLLVRALYRANGEINDKSYAMNSHPQYCRPPQR